MDTIISFFAATYGHLLNSLFLGFLPILLITSLACLVSRAISWKRRDSSLILIVFLFSVTGSVLGLLLGASREPAVQAFLPALITLIATVIFYALPQEKALDSFDVMYPEDKSELSKFKARYVVAAISSLMVTASMGSFWGGSIRGLKESDLRDYEEWRIQYEQIEVPGVAQDLGILEKPKQLEPDNEIKE